MSIKHDLRVIGIGSHHGSDATGWLACETLQSQTTSTRVDWQLCRTPAQLPDLVVDYKAVVILDAVISDKPLGQVLTLLWPVQQEGYHSSCSSHGLSVIDALQLASTLGQLPTHTYILGITTNRQQQDAAPVVKNALPQLQQKLEQIHRTLFPN
jgi:hydrogenase maturation protease